MVNYQLEIDRIMGGGGGGGGGGGAGYIVGQSDHYHN